MEPTDTHVHRPRLWSAPQVQALSGRKVTLRRTVPTGTRCRVSWAPARPRLRLAQSAPVNSGWRLGPGGSPTGLQQLHGAHGSGPRERGWVVGHRDTPDSRPPSPPRPAWTHLGVAASSPRVTVPVRYGAEETGPSSPSLSRVTLLGESTLPPKNMA